MAYSDSVKVKDTITLVLSDKDGIVKAIRVADMIVSGGRQAMALATGTTRGTPGASWIVLGSSAALNQGTRTRIVGERAAAGSGGGPGRLYGSFRRPTGSFYFERFRTWQAGCIDGEARVYTSFCGIEKMENMYNTLSEKYGEENSTIGKIVLPGEDIFTIGFDPTNRKLQRVRITAMHKIPVDGMATRIRANNLEILTSNHHPTLIRNHAAAPAYGSYRYKRADEIRYRDYLAIPTEFMTVTDAYQQIAYQRRPQNLHTYESMTISLNEDLAYLIGFFIGDGDLSHGCRGIRFSVDVRDKIGKLLELIKKVGFTYSLSPKKGSNGLTIQICGGFREILLALGFKEGEKSTSVEIPKPLLISPPSVILALTAGLIESDGYIQPPAAKASWAGKSESEWTHHRLEVSIRVASKTLAEQMVYIFSLMGFLPRYRKETFNSKTHMVNGHLVIPKAQMYGVHVGGRGAGNLFIMLRPYLRMKSVPENLQWVNRQYIRCVSKSEPVQYKGHFYDFTTESGNYLAGLNGFGIIHNSATGSLQEAGLVIQGTTDAVAKRLLGSLFNRGTFALIAKGASDTLQVRVRTAFGTS